MMLKNKNAVIYGAGGSIGGAVAKALASAGARVFLTGRNRSSVQKIADEIIDLNGNADVDQVDAFDEKAISEHLNKVVKQAGKIDISFNAVGINVVQNIPLVDLAAIDFVRPITDTMLTQFLTATAAGRIMINQKSGVILTLTATPGGIGYPYTGGFSAACCALESFSRNLASELGIYGIRVVNIRSGGSPDSRIFQEALAPNPEVMKVVLGMIENDTMLKKLPQMADIANVAVFLSSEMAAKITGVTIDVTSGTTAALNYRVPPK
ncbi:SDR family NAD(P)-dependent oxidoreductase [Mucilaginibacter aquaedulcis]|uniref:SDR family NAD(P)-dependent oxidoreductase n=1 Tax=Mucilaginibacter aquaedulcis TaxID=1187081 RepID=UPI0025B29AA1|nr:SDR family oxidoreductase [Mucilaginibacter aquaedulcis]MDN3548229.1 SDR family oxidoreductase [Mucilaginibacter aquaedulcis]